MATTVQCLTLSSSSLSFSSNVCPKNSTLSFPLSKLYTTAFDLKSRTSISRKGSEVQAALTLDDGSQTVKKTKKSKKTDPIGYGSRRIDLSQVIRYPLFTEAAVKNLANQNTLVFLVDVKADKKMIKAAVKTFLSVQPKKVNTSIRADGAKKAFVMLAPEDNASEVARKIGIFTGSATS